MGKPWYTSKTLWTGVTAIVAGIGVYVSTNDPQALGTAATGFLMIVFRIVTKQPLE